MYSMQQIMAAARAMASPPPDPPPTFTPQYLAIGQGSLAPNVFRVAATPAGASAKNVEIDRIVALPISPTLTPEQAEAVSAEHLLASAYASGFRYFPIQASAIHEFKTAGGLFAPIGAGLGKTLTAYTIAAWAYANGLSQRIAFFVPPSVYEQTGNTDLRWARTKITIPFAVYRTGGKSGPARRTVCRAARPGLYMIPYSQLSTADSEEMIGMLRPDMVILDECHSIKNAHAARTKRLMRYLRAESPRIVAMSGTVTSKGVKDYHHILTSTLHERSPLPLASSQAIEWGNVLDSEAEAEGHATGALVPLISWARSNFPSENIEQTRSGFRAAYRIRLRTAPGVCVSSDAEVGVSLSIHNKPVENHKVSPGYETLDRFVRDINEAWVTPNGDEIAYAMNKWKWLYELSAGFYNMRFWPTVDALSERIGRPFEEAADLLERSKDYHFEWQEYEKSLRSWLQSSHRPGLDTPELVGRSMYQHGSRFVGESLYKPWKSAKDKDFPGRIERDTQAVRVCPYKVDAAIEWAKEAKSGIVWYGNIEVGEWLADAAREAGIDAVHCPAGDTGNEAVSDERNKDRIVIASLQAHGTGKNLQHHHNQYVVQWPRPAAIAEQMIARTHRAGQKADDLIVHTNLTEEWDHIMFGACLNDAMYIHQSTGVRQRMVYAAYDPLPRIYPSEFLIERGLDAVVLDAESRKELESRFVAP